MLLELSKKYSLSNDKSPIVVINNQLLIIDDLNLLSMQRVFIYLIKLNICIINEKSVKANDNLYNLINNHTLDTSIS